MEVNFRYDEMILIRPTHANTTINNTVTVISEKRSFHHDLKLTDFLYRMTWTEHQVRVNLNTFEVNCN